MNLENGKTKKKTEQKSGFFLKFIFINFLELNMMVLEAENFGLKNGQVNQDMKLMIGLMKDLVMIVGKKQVDLLKKNGIKKKMNGNVRHAIILLKHLKISFKK